MVKNRGNKFFWVTLLILILIVFFLYQKNKSQPLTPKQECESKGGVWATIGLDQIPQCNLPTSDGGKICTDSNQCESVCIGEDESSINGKCADFQIVVGCHARIEHGQAQMLCVD